MQRQRLKLWLEVAKDIFGARYEFVQVVGLNGEERFYLADSVTAVTGKLKLRQDLGEDNFPILFAKNMTSEEIIELNRRKRFPLLNENLWIKVSFSRTRQTFVHLLGQIKAKPRSKTQSKLEEEKLCSSIY